MNRDHPLRMAITEEMHLRRLPYFAAPARILQFILFTSESSSAKVRSHLEELRIASDAQGASHSKHLLGTACGMQFAWEQHAEYASYTFVAEGAFDDPFREPLSLRLPPAWLQELPGKVLRATQLAILPTGTPEPQPEQLARWFDQEGVAICDVQGGEARLWSDFRVHEDGLGRYLLLSRSLATRGDTSRLVQMLQELGNYRNLAFLGLPAAQRLSEGLMPLEQDLVAVTGAVAEGNTSDEALLARVAQIAVEGARLSAAASFRMGATSAYARIAADRLQSCAVVRLPGYRSLSDFTERRLVPAVRTCESAWRRSEWIADQTNRVVSLLRARIETSLEKQNAALLASVDKRAKMQLRLQQSVEGISIVAIAYYATALISHIAKPLISGIGQVGQGIVLSGAASCSLLGSWWLLRRIGKSVSQK